MLAQVELLVLAITFLFFSHGICYPDRVPDQNHLCKNNSGVAKSKYIPCSNCPPQEVLLCNGCNILRNPSLKNFEATYARSSFFYEFVRNVPVEYCNPGAKLTYLIAINSLPENVVDRNIIRMDLWQLRNASSRLKFLFFMGRPTEAVIDAHVYVEANAQGDIVMGDFLGTSANTTLTTVMILRWMTQYCTNADFLLKIDDAGRVNAHFLMTYYGHFKDLSRDNEMFGNLVPLDGKPCFDSPYMMYVSSCTGRSFLTGCAYMMTADVIEPLLRATTHNELIPSENIYVTDILAQSVNARKADVPHFSGCYVTFTKSVDSWEHGLLYWIRDRLRRRRIELARVIQ